MRIDLITLATCVAIAVGAAPAAGMPEAPAAGVPGLHPTLVSDGCGLGYNLDGRGRCVTSRFGFGPSFYPGYRGRRCVIRDGAFGPRRVCFR